MGRRRGGYRTDALHHADECLPRLRVRHLVLFLIRLLDEGSSDLVELSESWNDPDRLRAALLGGLWGSVAIAHAWLRALHPE